MIDISPNTNMANVKTKDAFEVFDTKPPKLYDLCLEYLVENISRYTHEDDSGKLSLTIEVNWPPYVCEDFLLTYQKHKKIDDNVASLFSDSYAIINKVILRNATLTDEGFQRLMEHDPIYVEVNNCPNLTSSAIDLINEHGMNLISIKLHSCELRSRNEGKAKPILFKLPNLRQLVMYRCNVSFLETIHLKMYKHITYLDMSECFPPQKLNAFKLLVNLNYLIMHGVFKNKDDLSWLTHLKKLRYLDISQSKNNFGIYQKPDRLLHTIVSSLPKLEGLDISGTNLAGTGAGHLKDKISAVSTAPCDIAGLQCRVSRPLEFLGLYRTHHSAAKRHHIPAKNISGDANEKQIMTAAEAYMERPAILSRVLNDLYYLIRHESATDSGKALYIVLEAMRRHVNEKHIQISASAILFYIIKAQDKERIGSRLKRVIIKCLLNAMEAHLHDEIMMRNGCLTLCQFKVPNDVMYEYERIVKILLERVSYVPQENFVQRIAIYLLNTLACQVDGDQKLFLGDRGAISTLIAVIQDRLDQSLCDDVLEVSWSALWNVTDETPENCRKFLDNNGMDYFIECLRAFPDKDELLRNMMGLLGNVAEVEELRPQLMNSVFLSVFESLLSSTRDGIEVSYNAAGVLAHIASDGPEAWTVSNPEREMVLQSMTEAINRWNVHAERNINYRSLTPILKLLSITHTHQCQHWAVWALANLTSVYPEKYCKLVEKEGGLVTLRDLALSTAELYEQIRELAVKVMDNCTQYFERESPEEASKDE